LDARAASRAGISAFYEFLREDENIALSLFIAFSCAYLRTKICTCLAKRKIHLSKSGEVLSEIGRRDRVGLVPRLASAWARLWAWRLEADQLHVDHNPEKPLLSLKLLRFINSPKIDPRKPFGHRRGAVGLAPSHRASGLFLCNVLSPNGLNERGRNRASYIRK
jgi:hypothetical protein